MMRLLVIFTVAQYPATISHQMNIFQDSEHPFGHRSTVLHRLFVMCWLFTVIYYISDNICYDLPPGQSCTSDMQTVDTPSAFCVDYP
ncbi:hypothetical protein EDC04DRAFT_2697793 [Pisolithus marmoratus]|nr:hypothetical protein EDC04DRAFT_2741124 [Pisolithus marmoratus]KAI6038169.1 hypothetical protein EDC04DRAFT_2697793 [Pisolithus marmoratus]